MSGTILAVGVDYTYTVDVRAFLKAQRALRRDIRDAINTTMREVVNRAEHDAKTTTRYNDKTGAMRRRTYGRFVSAGPEDDAASGFIIADADYAVYVEKGTGPHTIYPRRARALRFEVNGQVFFRARVRHPGTKARPFMDDARERAEWNITNFAEHYLGAAIDTYEQTGDTSGP